MSLVRFYLYQDSVVIPTVVVTDNGLFVDVAPVTVMPKTDTEKLKSILRAALAGQNPPAKRSDQEGEPESAILEKLKLEKWVTFEKKAIMYTIHRGVSYQKIYITVRGYDGMWGREGREREFDKAAPLDDVIDAAIDDLVNYKEPPPKGTGLIRLSS